MDTRQSSTVLRQYQIDSIDLIQQKYKSGIKKVLLHLATGAGKTTIFCELLKRCRDKNKRCLMVVRGRKLVCQASARLSRENVPHGTYMSKHPLFAPDELIQVCSIDTLHARQLAPPADLIVIDEAHLATSTAYVELCKRYPEAYFLPVTATPYTKKSISHIAEEIVSPIDFKGLVSQGYLVSPKYLSIYNPDLTNIKRTQTAYGMDYNNKQLCDVMADSGLITGLPEKWKKYGENRPTLIFAVNVYHSKLIKDSFIKAGINCEHMDAKTPDDQREHTLKLFEMGIIKVITNVGILSLGVDIPCASCIIMARPTCSPILYIQQLGRGTRPYKDKKDFLILDFTGNVLKHGFIDRERPINLDGNDFKKDPVPEYSTCPKCYVVYENDICPNCGYSKPVEEIPTIDKLKQAPELFEISDNPIQEAHNRYRQIAKEKKYNRWWAYHRLKEEYGEKVAKFYYPFYGVWKR